MPIALPQPMDVSQALAPEAPWDTLIDARSPAEFAEDHLPGAVNWPVLDDAERATVGTLHAKVSPLAARKQGSVMAARNIAALVEAHVQDRPREWRPLVYCWRGGQRSGSLALVLAQIGFRTAQLQGGYKAFRALVRADLEVLPGRLRYAVLCGRTGSGKTRLLQALQAQGAQVLDLEGLAHHRGSVLGGMPGLPQPTQKHFDTRVWHALRGFDPARPVFVESESARIGTLRVPEQLLQAMRGHGRVLRVDTPFDTRAALLMDDYDVDRLDAEALCELLATLTDLRGHETVQRWQGLARRRDWATLVPALMSEHYDPLYDRSMRRSYPGLDQAPGVVLGGPAAADFDAAAQQLLALAAAP